MGYDKLQRPVSMPDEIRVRGITESTAASTSLAPRGVISIATTSTGAPVVYTLGEGKPGDRLSIGVKSLGSSSAAPIHINAGNAVFCYGAASTEFDMVALSTNGAAFEAVRLNSSEWLVTAVRDATFSAST